MFFLQFWFDSFVLRCSVNTLNFKMLTFLNVSVTFGSVDRKKTS